MSAFTPPTELNLSEYQRTELIRRASRVIAHEVRKGLTPASLLALRLRVNREVREYLEAFRLSASPKPPPIACKPGCNHCCTTGVETHPHEVFIAKAYLDITSPAGVHEQVITRDEAMKQETPKTRLCSVMCGLNGTNGECLVYPVQPFLCAAGTSYSVANCLSCLRRKRRIDWRGCPRQDDVFMAVRQAFLETLDQYGYPTDPVELTPAIRTAYENPSSWEQWFRDRVNPFTDAGWGQRGYLIPGNISKRR